MGSVRRLVYVASFASLLAATACSSSDKPDATASGTTTTSGGASGAPGVPESAVVSGTSTLDGRPFDSRWVGAVVLDKGLITPCQATLPPVRSGRYSVPVLADPASTGCGKPGVKVALWIYANDKILFSTNTAAWPANGKATTFAATYSSASPNGATPATAQFSGRVADRDGHTLPAGTRVDAYIGGTRCGVASSRVTPEFVGYILSVVGSDSISGCTRGAPITFRINGKPALAERAVNTPPGPHDAFDLRQR